MISHSGIHVAELGLDKALNAWAIASAHERPSRNPYEFGSAVVSATASLYNACIARQYIVGMLSGRFLLFLVSDFSVFSFFIFGSCLTLRVSGFHFFSLSAYLRSSTFSGTDRKSETRTSPLFFILSYLFSAAGIFSLLFLKGSLSHTGFDRMSFLKK